MAEFLIYNKTHWYDLPSNLEPSKTGYERNYDNIDLLPISELEKVIRRAKLQTKYEAKYILGDVVEIRQDGTGMSEKEKEDFVLLKVPTIAFETAKDYSGALIEEGVIKRNFKFNIDISGLNFNVDNEAELQTSTLMGRLTVKSG